MSTHKGSLKVSGHSYQHTDVVSLVILCPTSSFTSRMHLTTGRIDLHYIFSVACICLITYFNTVISVHVCMSVCKKALITLILLNILSLLMVKLFMNQKAVFTHTHTHMRRRISWWMMKISSFKEPVKKTQRFKTWKFLIRKITVQYSFVRQTANVHCACCNSVSSNRSEVNAITQVDCISSDRE